MKVPRSPGWLKHAIPGLRGSRDRGSGTVLGLAAIGVLCVLLVAGLMVSSALLASNQARTAADLAAVGGAQRLLVAQGDASVCARAAEVALRNAARLESCKVGQTANSGPTVTVVVSVKAGVLGNATASAKAGLTVNEQR